MSYAHIDTGRHDFAAEARDEARDEALQEVSQRIWEDKACWHLFQGMGAWSGCATPASWKTHDLSLVEEVISIIHTEWPFGVSFNGKNALAIVEWHLVCEEYPASADWDMPQNRQAAQDEYLAAMAARAGSVRWGASA